MTTLIVHPENKEQLAALKAVMNVLKISFEEQKKIYDPQFVAKILEGDEDIKAGRTTRITLDDICK